MVSTATRKVAGPPLRGWPASGPVSRTARRPSGPRSGSGARWKNDILGGRGCGGRRGLAVAGEIGGDRIDRRVRAGCGRLGLLRRRELGAGDGGQVLQFADQPVVAAGRLLPLLGEFGQDVLHPVDRLEDGGDGGGAHRGAVAELADDGFGRVGQRFQTGQADEAAGALHRMNQPEDVPQDLAVVGLLLETDEFPINRVEILAGLSQKLLQQVVHARTITQRNTWGH